MTKAISSFPEEQRKAIVARRLAEKKGGLGFLAAQDYAGGVARRNAERAKKVAQENSPAPVVETNQ
jgi:hypothetical protein